MPVLTLEMSPIDASGTLPRAMPRSQRSPSLELYLALLPSELRLHILSCSTYNFSLLAAVRVDRKSYRRSFEAWHHQESPSEGSSSPPRSRLETRFGLGLPLSLTYYLSTPCFSTLHSFITDPGLWVTLAAQNSLTTVLFSLLSFSTSRESLAFPVPCSEWDLSDARGHALRTDDLPLFATLQAVDTIDTIKAWSASKCYPFGKSDGLAYQCYVPVAPIDAAALLGSINVLSFMHDINSAIGEVIYSWSSLAVYFAKARGHRECAALVAMITAKNLPAPTC
ncbi:hypothetical protein BJ742DRAFT_822417 [Cladochytrium replicatum]|nr:hypothetical protein BJ742DRAFT_822417 [Cladochytrium replicatum]